MATPTSPSSTSAAESSSYPTSHKPSASRQFVGRLRSLEEEEELVAYLLLLEPLYRLRARTAAAADAARLSFRRRCSGWPQTGYGRRAVGLT